MLWAPVQAAPPSLVTHIIKTMSALESHSLGDISSFTVIASGLRLAKMSLWSIWMAFPKLSMKWEWSLSEFVLPTMPTVYCSLGTHTPNRFTAILWGKNCWWSLEKEAEAHWSGASSEHQNHSKPCAQTWLSTALITGDRGMEGHVSIIS